ncbi:ABC transporter permease [Paenibacillus eucommiae]|uniref:ABC-type polysaccharide transport system permease subunit n=1 Tax=Paenibacillus eucommiae TaxID=1355755 RepID=A0ABS4IRZ1_9BACL|nr:ABC transporter permease subunit [Paenibacillus eucommiae]MBP1990336.1 ABC-type polysaccharide transport system permease subunit [Paenibacillus eucommiae]
MQPQLSKKPQGAALVFSRVKQDVISKYQLYLLILLPLTYIIVFQYFPMYGLQIAFKNFIATKGISGSPWVGLKHFEQFFNSPFFWIVIKNTLILTLYGLIVGFPIPIILALLLNNSTRTRFKKVVQIVTYAPHFISVVVMVGMLYQFLSPKYGIVNRIIVFFGGEPFLFMGSENWFTSLYVWSDIWQHMGWSSIIYLSALATVDPQQHEAAIVDGASRFKRMLHVDIPAIMPTAIILLILNTGYLLSVGFEKVYLMQNTMNLGSSEVISTYLYKLSFASSLPNYSYSTAIGFFNSLANFLVLCIVNSIAKRFGKSGIW